MRLAYNASAPLGVTRSGSNYVAAAGALRVWKANGSIRRNGRAMPSGDYVEPGIIYAATDLDFSAQQGSVTLYIEAINPTAEASIHLEVDPDGPGPKDFVCVDQMKVSPLKVELEYLREKDDVCNRVLNLKQNTDTRLFAATEATDQAELFVKAAIQPAGIEDKILCAAYDGSTRLPVSAAFSTASEAEN